MSDSGSRPRTNSSAQKCPCRWIVKVGREDQRKKNRKKDAWCNRCVINCTTTFVMFLVKSAWLVKVLYVITSGVRAFLPPGFIRRLSRVFKLHGKDANFRISYYTCDRARTLRIRPMRDKLWSSTPFAF